MSQGYGFVKYETHKFSPVYFVNLLQRRECLECKIVLHPLFL